MIARIPAGFQKAIESRHSIKTMMYGKADFKNFNSLFFICIHLAYQTTEQLHVIIFLVVKLFTLEFKLEHQITDQDCCNNPYKIS